MCSTRGLGPHTDHYRADLIAWECVTAAPSGGQTFVVDPRPAFEELSPSQRALLASARVFEHRLFADDPADRPVMSGTADELRFYFTYWLARTTTEEEQAAVDRFRELLEEPDRAVRFRLAPGDLLVIDNRRLLHGREAFAGDRHLTRVWLSADRAWTPQWLSSEQERRP